MTSATALVLLGFGIGALVVADHAASRGPRSLRESADTFRTLARQAQERSAATAQRARELANQWSIAEDAARKAGM